MTRKFAPGRLNHGTSYRPKSPASTSLSAPPKSWSSPSQPSSRSSPAPPISVSFAQHAENQVIARAAVEHVVAADVFVIVEPGLDRDVGDREERRAEETGIDLPPGVAPVPVAVVAVQDVIARPAMDLVRAAAAKERVVRRRAENPIVALLPRNPVALLVERRRLGSSVSASSAMRSA